MLVRQLLPFFFAAAFALQSIDLGGKGWKFSNSNGTITGPATVPGSIHTDLLAAGIIGDPFYRFGDTELRWISYDSWTYASTFNVDSSFLSSGRVMLVLDGVDTVSTITINGGGGFATDNMFRRYSFDVTSLLHAGSNTITVALQSAVSYVKAQSAAYPYKCPSSDSAKQRGELFRNYMRKEQCSFSWDWGPGFITQGIWRALRLEAIPEAAITAVVPELFVTATAANPQNPAYKSPTAFAVKTTVHLRAAAAGVSGVVQVSVAGQSASAAVGPTAAAGELAVSVTLNVAQPSLWWPNEMGAQTLYDMAVSFKGARGDVVTAAKKIGFRSVELVTKKLADGTSMYFQVNGVPVFLRGANWIPASPFPNTVAPADLARLLGSARAAHMNMVRVWGGGIYQVDEFYDTADQLGLMVWEEIMFACAMYPRNPEFLDNVDEEVRYQIRRLASHPSIVLWSGNNENEGALWWYPESQSNRDLYLADYIKLYIDTVRPAILDEDASRPFWPSSPSNGPVVDQGEFYVLQWGNVQNDKFGDVHYYNYINKCTDWTFFPKPRMASEYGFQSYPSYAVVAPTLSAADMFYNSSLMENRQHHDDGTAQIVAQMGMFFNKLPTTSAPDEHAFRSFIYLTQVVQSMCIAAETEHYRRGRDTAANTMGALYWQLNDIWAGQSWSSLDAGGHWKALHYAARRFLEPLHVSAYEEGSLLPALHVHIANDDPWRAWAGDLVVELWSWAGGKVVASTTKSGIIVQPNQGAEVFNQVTELILPRGVKRTDVVVVLRARPGLSTNPATSQHVFFLSAFKDAAMLPATASLVDVQMVDAATANVTVVTRGQGLQPFVTLDAGAAASGGVDGYFDDNLLLMRPDEPASVLFHGWAPFSADQLRQSMHIYTIADALAH